MGYRCLARWGTSGGGGYAQVCDIIMRNHLGQIRNLAGQEIARQLFTLTGPDVCYALVDDPASPYRQDWNPNDPPPLHFKETFVALSGPIDELLAQTSTESSKWIKSPNQVVIDGYVFAIGTDWLVRVGAVLVPGGQNRGILLETEYLPLPKIHESKQGSHITTMSIGLVTSLLPTHARANTRIINMYSDTEWIQVLGPIDDFVDPAPAQAQEATKHVEEDEDDLYAYGVSGSKQSPEYTPDRDNWRRSVYLIHSLLRSEGVLG